MDRWSDQCWLQASLHLQQNIVGWCLGRMKQDMSLLSIFLCSSARRRIVNKRGL